MFPHPNDAAVVIGETTSQTLSTVPGLQYIFAAQTLAPGASAITGLGIAINLQGGLSVVIGGSITEAIEYVFADF
jgi:hypothetical protein